MDVRRVQLMTDEEHNGPGFYYLVRWRRHDLAPTAKFEERPVDSKSNMAVIDGQSVYKPYEIYVVAVNDAGDAVSPPRMLIGYSSEDGPLSHLSLCLSVCCSHVRRTSSRARHVTQQHQQHSRSSLTRSVLTAL